MSEAKEARRTIHVVAGVLTQGDLLCITRRRRDAPQGGKWELPGGKLEPGEDPLAGLKRELAEELGVDVREARRFLQLRHAYADFDVVLDVWRVPAYAGTPHGRESQELRWAPITTLDPEEFPEADRPVLRRLQLPPLYLVSDARRFGMEEFARRLERALRAGARLVQLREPHMDRASFCAYARRLASLCRPVGARLLINADPAWLADCNADGVHLNARRLTGLFERPLGPEGWLGASCHEAAELERAASMGADFAVLGAVQPTASHPAGAVLGWARFASLCRAGALPIYGIGGMRPGDLARARAAGAQGLAMISGIWEREDLEAAVRSVMCAGQASRASAR